MLKTKFSYCKMSMSGFVPLHLIILRARKEEKCHGDEEWEDEGTHLFRGVTWCMYKKGRCNKMVSSGWHYNAEIEKVTRHNMTHPTILKNNPTINNIKLIPLTLFSSFPPHDLMMLPIGLCTVPYYGYGRTFYGCIFINFPVTHTVKSFWKKWTVWYR